MFNLKISNLDEAPALASGWATKVVSLLNTSGDVQYVFGGDHRTFFFDDLESEKEECHRPGMHHAPTIEDIRHILAFTSTFTDDDNVLIHCHGGLCRSPAVAMLALIQHGMSKEDAINLIREVRPPAMTNLLIIRLGDVILKQNGELIQFMTEWDKKEVQSLMIGLDKD